MASPAVTAIPQPDGAEFLFGGSGIRWQTIHVEAAGAGPIALDQPPIRDLHACSAVPAIPVNLQAMYTQTPHSRFVKLVERRGFGVLGKLPSPNIVVRPCVTGR